MLPKGCCCCVATALTTLCLILTGCHTLHVDQCAAPGVARELDKVTLPDHVIEPTDILLITGVRLVPKPPYRIEPLDSLYVRVVGAPAEDPIDGVFIVEADGRLLIGPTYGSVSVAGLTTEQAREAIDNLLKGKLLRYRVFVSLLQSRALQVVTGEHLVQPNGKVDLGTYGSVFVTGMTTDEARAVIEAHLAAYLQGPAVSVKVASFNSKVYYIITDGGGFGEAVYRFPATGNETVLDAMSQVYGLPVVASRKRIWIARPAPAHQPEQVLPVDWKAVTRGGATASNYQILPGDRIYVQAHPIITADVALARIISPFERLFGITLLGNVLVESLKPGFGVGGN